MAEIIRCEHIEKYSEPEMRAITIGTNRYVALCKYCDRQMTVDVVSSDIGSIVREVVREEVGRVFRSVARA